MQPRVQFAPAPCNLLTRSDRLLPAHRRSNSSLQSGNYAAPPPALTPAPMPAAPRQPWGGFPAPPPPALLPLGLPYGSSERGALARAPEPVMVQQERPRMQTGDLSALTALLYPAAAPLGAAPFVEAAPRPAPPPELARQPSLGLALAPSLALQPSADLGALFGPPLDAGLPTHASQLVPAKQESGTGEDWLTWEDWQLPALF